MRERIQVLAREKRALVGLGCHLTDFTYMPFDVSLVFRLEFYPWIFDDYGIVLLEALATVFLPKARDDIFERFVLSKQALVLTAALDGGPASDKGCHLLEDFAGPE